MNSTQGPCFGFRVYYRVLVVGFRVYYGVLFRGLGSWGLGFSFFFLGGGEGRVVGLGVTGWAFICAGRIRLSVNPLHP